MQTTHKQELYRAFIEFVRNEIQLDRNVANRKMISVFLWCFIAPAVVSVAFLILINRGILPRSMRSYLDWLILVFPIAYSIYFLSVEVLKDVPKNFRRGGLATALGQAIKEDEWRTKVMNNMKKTFQLTAYDWRWLATNFEMDLKTMLFRAKYLTALAGAVFFLIMQGIDSITGTGADMGEKVVWEKKAALGWVGTSTSDFTQFIGLGLFLLLLYLSGVQTYNALKRYLNCVELVIFEKNKEM